MWNQHHCLLLIHYLLASRLLRRESVAGYLRIWIGQFCVCFPGRLGRFPSGSLLPLLIDFLRPLILSEGMLRRLWDVLFFNQILSNRRNLLLFTFPNMAWTLLAAGLCFIVPSDNAARVPLIALFVFLFAGMVLSFFINELISLWFSILFTWGGTCTLHLLCGSVPSYPQRDGNVLGSCNLFILGCSIVNNIPSNAGSYGSWRRLVHLCTCVYLFVLLILISAFGFYAGLNVLAFVLIFFLLPGAFLLYAR